jgi:hypothetical protein
MPLLSCRLGVVLDRASFLDRYVHLAGLRVAEDIAQPVLLDLLAQPDAATSDGGRHLDARRLPRLVLVGEPQHFAGREGHLASRS